MFSSVRESFRSFSRPTKKRTETNTATDMTMTRGRASVGPLSPLAIRDTSMERPLSRWPPLEGQNELRSNLITQQSGWTNRPSSFEWVSQEQFQNVLENFRVAHSQVELQRDQMKEQEKQIVLLKGKVARLEGGDFDSRVGHTNRNIYKGVSSTGDLAIKNSASSLAALINRYASTLVVRHPHLLAALLAAVIKDNMGNEELHPDMASLRVQSLLRHAISKVVCSGVINRMLVTDSSETNEQLQIIHERILSHDPVLAGVWRRQTFFASVREFSQILMAQTLKVYMPSLFTILLIYDEPPIKTSTDVLSELEPIDRSIPKPLVEILQLAWEFSRLLHNTKQTFASSGEGLYKAFVPELGSPLDATQMELVKRCHRSENQEEEVLGACLFPGLVKIGRDSRGRDSQIVVRRAQVICSCALLPRWQMPISVLNIPSSTPLSTSVSLSVPTPIPEITKEGFEINEGDRSRTGYYRR